MASTTSGGSEHFSLLLLVLLLPFVDSIKFSEGVGVDMGRSSRWYILGFISSIVSSAFVPLDDQWLHIPYIDRLEIECRHVGSI
jgi:hypothetical protein